jgi:hypothetical protein
MDLVKEFLELLVGLWEHIVVRHKQCLMLVGLFILFARSSWDLCSGSFPSSTRRRKSSTGIRTEKQNFNMLTN